MVIETSVDVMYVVISVCIVIFTGFLVWIMFYVAQILRQGNEVIGEIRIKIAEFEETLDQLKERVVSSATSISYIASEIGGVVELVKGMKKKTRKKGAKK